MNEAQLLRMIDAQRDQINALIAEGNCDRSVYLAAPLTSVAWDGDSYSTTAKTLIDLSAVFGVPAQVRWVDVYVYIRDSASAATSPYLVLSPNAVAFSGPAFSCVPVDDRWAQLGVHRIPCDANGDIYYQIVASGADTFDVIMQVWGYGW